MIAIAYYRPTTPTLLHRYTHEMAMSWASAIAVLSSFRIFRFLSLVDIVYTFWLTLANTMWTLCVYMLILLVFIMCYAWSGHTLYGPRVRAMHSLSSTMSTLLRWMAGDFDYAPLTEAQPRLTWIYFLTYMFIVFLIVLNMLPVPLILAHVSAPSSR